MFAASSSQIMGFGDIIKNVLDYVFSNTIGQIFRPIINYINTAYFFICKTIYSAFLLPIGRVMDIIQMIFRKFAGIDSMTIKNLNRNRFFGAFGDNGDIVYDLISSDIVQRIFFAMMILAIILLIVTTFVANIKSEFNSYEKGGNVKTKVFKNAFKGLLNFIAVPVISIFAIILSNGLLRAIDGATQVNGAQTYLSGQLFVACGYNANRARNSQLIDENGEASYVENSFGALLTDVNWTGKEGAWGVRYLSSGAGYANFGIFLDDAQSGLQYNNGANSQTGMGYGFRAADKIDTAFATGLSLDVKEDSPATQLYYGPALDFWYGGMDLISSSASFVLSGAGTAPGGYTTFPEGYKMSFGAFRDAASDGTNLWGFMTGEGPTFVLKYATNRNDDTSVEYGHISFSIYDTALVFYYYDLGLTNFSYIMFIIAGAYFCYVLLATSVGLIKRMFMVTTLFIISPPVCALYPIDEGKALERWRKNFVQELTSAYATIIVMNIFLSLLPLFTSIEVFGTGYLSKRVLQLFPLYTWSVDPNTFEQSVAGTSAGIASSAVMFVVCGFLNAIARLLIIIGALHFFAKANKAIAEVLGTGNAFEDGSGVLKSLGKTIGGAAALAIGGGAMLAAKGKKPKKPKKPNQYTSNQGTTEPMNSDVGPSNYEETGDLNVTAPNQENSMNGNAGANAVENGGVDKNNKPDDVLSLTNEQIADKYGLKLGQNGELFAQVKRTKSGKIDGRTKLGRMLKQTSGGPVSPAPVGGSSETSPSQASTGSSKASSSSAIPSSFKPASYTSTEPTPNTSDAPELINHSGEKVTKRNSWQRVSKFANSIKMLYAVATGKSGLTDTMKTMEALDENNETINPYKNKMKESRKRTEGELKSLMDERERFVQKNVALSNRIKSLPKNSPQLPDIFKEVEKNNSEITALDNRIKEKDKELNKFYNEND